VLFTYFEEEGAR